MSTGAIGPSAAPGELAAFQRVQQIQALIAQTRKAVVPGAGVATTTAPMTSTGPTSSSEPAGFAAALQSATTNGTSGVTGAQPTPSNGSDSAPYDAMIAQAAQHNGLDPAVLHGLIQQESGFDPNSHSGAGAAGLTQLMPGTASSLGVMNPLDPAESIEGGARYLSQMMRQFAGNTSDALAAYNAGPGAVQKYGGMPPYAETQSYVTKVLGYAEAFRQSQPATGAASTVGSAGPSSTVGAASTVGATGTTGATSAGSVQ